MSAKRSTTGRTAADRMRDVRAGRRDALIAAGALVDAYRSTRSRTVPSGKRYDRRDGKRVARDDQ